MSAQTRAEELAHEIRLTVERQRRSRIVMREYAIMATASLIFLLLLAFLFQYIWNGLLQNFQVFQCVQITYWQAFLLALLIKALQRSHRPIPDSKS